MLGDGHRAEKCSPTRTTKPRLHERCQPSPDTLVVGEAFDKMQEEGSRI